jgi:hypothetical protein
MNFIAGGHVHDRYLSREHRLQLIIRPNALDHGNGEIQASSIYRVGAGELRKKATDKITICYAESLDAGLKFYVVQGHSLLQSAAPRTVLERLHSVAEPPPQNT